MRIFINLTFILILVIFSSCDGKKKGSQKTLLSQKSDFIKNLKLQKPTYHIESLHHIQKVGTRLSQSIDNPIFINLMPKNTQEYQHIYETEIVSTSAKVQIEKYNNDLDSHSFKKENFESKNEILNFIKQSSSTPIIIFGHSLHGKTLVLPNGNKYSISNIHKECKNNHKTCLVLTCNGDDFNIEGKVTASEALSMFSHSYDAYTNGEIFKVKELKNKMIKQREVLKNKHMIIVSFTIIDISTGATYLVYDFIKEKK